MKDSSMKDRDLDLLLSELKSQAPSDLQLRKWKKAVHNEIHIDGRRKRILWIQLTAASLIGFLIGAIVFKSAHQEDSFQNLGKVDGDNATVEYVLTKTH